MYGTPFLLVVVNNNLIDLVDNRIRAKRGSFSSAHGSVILHGLCGGPELCYEMVM
jgi:hypothetical protein